MLTEVKILHSQHLIQDKYNTIGTTVDTGLLPLCPPLNPQ
jgi:hypothetical protein